MANVIFNCDSTLVSFEGPDELARKKGIKGVEELTERAMSGGESFAQIFKQRFELLSPTLEDIHWLGEQYIARIIPDAPSVIRQIQQDGHYVFIVSASYRPAILQLARYLGIPSLNICAVDLEFGPDGSYRGYDSDNILTTDAGIRIVSAEIAKLGPTFYVGDSIRDLDAIHSVDAFIGFGGVRYREEVKEQSDFYVDSPTLAPVVDFIRSFTMRDSRRTMAEVSVTTG